MEYESGQTIRRFFGPVRMIGCEMYLGMRLRMSSTMMYQPLARGAKTQAELSSVELNLFVNEPL